MKIAIAMIVTVSFAACLSCAGILCAQPTERSGVKSAPLEKATNVAGSTTLFHELAPQSTGVDFVNPIDTEHPLKRLYTSGYGGAGVAAGDLDGDGRCDLYFVSGARENRLYRNLGDGTFADITQAAGVGGGNAWGGGAALVDIDADGDLDIYVCNYESPHQLFLNDGAGKFTEAARQFGLDQSAAFLMAAFADYDGDGDLDVYLLGHRYYRPTGRPAGVVALVKNGTRQMLPQYEDYYGIKYQGGDKYDIDIVGASDRLLRNDGGTFVDVTSQAGISLDRNQGNSVTWWDFNHDGLPDIYVGNDFDDPDLLYRNNGNGTFTDVAKQQLPHTAWFTMGADCGDINNDGLMDFLAADMAGTTHYKSKTTMGAMGGDSKIWFMQNADPPQYMRNCLYVNTGTGHFMDAAFMSGIAASDWAWAVKFGDLDCDGRIDVFISNGMTRNFTDSDHPLDVKALTGNTEWDLHEDGPARPERNLAYRNRGDFDFSEQSAKWGLDHKGISYAAAYFDLEGDGDLDLAVANLDEPPTILRNDGISGTRVVLQLRGEDKNRSGIGASVRVRTKHGLQIRQFNPMRGFSSSDEPLVYFGLGNAEEIDELSVTWPSGKVSTLQGLPTGRRYTIAETDASTPNGVKAKPAEPMFVSSSALRNARHWEGPFDDFAAQPLLPNRLSQNGPGIACGDIDGDGDEDLFVGGSFRLLGHLMFNTGDGRYDVKPFAAGEPHKVSEDLGAVFFDSDRDGDLDLYVVSGSVEAPSTHPVYRDRLYTNDGRGNFSPAKGDALPANADSGSVVTAADYDRDGDLDLFVGGRVIAERYPETPKSCLLENNDGKFRDIANSTPGLGNSGLVTGALWTDANGDGWIDLLVTNEWGPVRLFLNSEGTLTEATTAAGLDKRLGWWTGVSGGDFDNDGDIDYVVTNFGLNTKYKASLETPELLFYGDIEGEGRNRIIEAGFENGQIYPHRGFSCSSKAMPCVREKVSTYHAFASAVLTEIYTPNRLQNAQRFEANTLETGILINDGNAKFTFKPLPKLAQISPAFGSSVLDVDGDGHVDIYLVQNFHGPQIETRPMNDGLSVLLLGDGSGKFESVPPLASGLIVPEDAMSLVVTDLAGDGRPDFVVGINDGPVRAFENRTSSVPLAVLLVGAAGNPTAIGGQVTIEYSDGSKRVSEVTAGGGYLSQSSPTLYFSSASSATQVSVRWPDGSRTTQQIEAGASQIAISQQH